MKNTTNAVLYFAETLPDKLPGESVATNEDDLYFFVRLGETYKRVAWKDVVYLRSEQHYTCLYNAADRKEYLIRASLSKTLHNIMPAAYRALFAQINRAEAVQLSYITEFCCTELQTAYGKMMLSEGYYRELKAKIICIA